MKAIGRLLPVSFALVTLCLAQDKALTNEDIVTMVRNGFGGELIVTMISTSVCDFETDVESLLSLKKEGVTDEVIRAMLLKSAGELDSASQVTIRDADTSKESDNDGLPSYIGVYCKKDGEWLEILPEVVNWKTGGVLKSVATVGVIDRDVNGKIDGAQSPNQIREPLEFVINTPEGVAITEYQFIRLREKKNRREFRTVTGGVFHTSGGSTRDLVPFEWTRIASEAYSVRFATLPPGEYGFLPPGAITSSHASASLGKMYTFSVHE